MIRIISIFKLGLLLVGSLPVMAEAAEQAAGPLISDPVGAGDFMQMFFGLLLVLGVIFGMAWFIRRMGNLQPLSHGALRILGGLSVGQRERIVLVQVGDTQLLIGLAPGQIRTLHVLEKTVMVNTGNTASEASFAERLQSVIRGKAKS